MLDAVKSEAAIFDPNEVNILMAAFKLACGNLRLPAGEHSKMALLVHNLGRSRLRLNRALKTRSDLRDIAGEAIEIFTYMNSQQKLTLAEDRPLDMTPSISIPSTIQRTEPHKKLRRTCRAAAI